MWSAGPTVGTYPPFQTRRLLRVTDFYNKQHLELWISRPPLEKSVSARWIKIEAVYFYLQTGLLVSVPARAMGIEFPWQRSSKHHPAYSTRGKFFKVNARGRRKWSSWTLCCRSAFGLVVPVADTTPFSCLPVAYPNNIPRLTRWMQQNGGPSTESTWTSSFPSELSVQSPRVGWRGVSEMARDLV